MVLKKYLPILRSSPFFKGLKDNEILSILHCVNATVISKERDSYIFRAGDSTELMGYFLESVNIFPKSFLLFEIKHTSCIYHTIIPEETKVQCY